MTIPALSGSRLADGFGPILLSRSAPNLFHFIALLIHKFLFNLICRHCYGNRTGKGCAHNFAFPRNLSPFLPLPSLFFPFLVVSSIRFHLLLVSASGDYSKRTFRGFAHSKCAITAQSATFPQDDVMLCTLRSFRFMERCFRELGFFFKYSSSFDILVI